MTSIVLTHDINEMATLQCLRELFPHMVRVMREMADFVGCDPRVSTLLMRRDLRGPPIENNHTIPNNDVFLSFQYLVFS